MSQYQIPRFGSTNDQIAGYMREATQQGEAWLATQRPSSEWMSIIERLSASIPQAELSGQSNATYNKTERVARELVASLGSFAHDGEFKPSSDKKLYNQAGALTKLDRHWNNQEDVYLTQRAGLQYGIALGTGYLGCEWDKHYHGMYKGDIRLTAYAPDRVTFVQLPSDNDIQRAYIVLIKHELPITFAKRVYAQTNPAFAAALQPDRSAPGWISKGLRKVQEFLSPALRVRGTRPGDVAEASFPTCDIFHAYIMDDAVNDIGINRQMGAMGTNWSYQVPSLGDPINMGIMNPATGQNFTRPAEPSDCALFPLRRLVIFARSTDIIAYDGSSPWWHGMVPLARFRFNDWPWEALGRSCVGMIGSLDDSMNNIFRGMEDSIAVRLDPPVLYNDQMVSQSFAEAFNPRKAGVRAAANLDGGKVLEFPVPPGQYDVGSWIPEHLRYLDDRAEYLTGVRDLTAIAKAKQLPSGDSIEKLLEMAGPLTQDMVRAIVGPLRQLGEMRKAYYFQFYTYQRILQASDATGQPEDWLYTPDQLVNTIEGEPIAQRQNRARQLLSEFTYSVTQSGISEINRMTTKLFYAQLLKLGFPLDWWTFAKIAQISNFGPEPEETHNVMERWIAQQHIQAEIQANLQEEMAMSAAETAAKTGGLGAPGTGGPPAPGGEGGGGGPAGPAGPKRPGRPSSFNAPPKLVSKDGGERSTMTTS